MKRLLVLALAFTGLISRADASMQMEACSAGAQTTYLGSASFMQQRCIASSTACTSRTFVALANEALVNADGGHAALEAGPNVDYSAECWVKFDALNGNQEIMYNGGLGIAGQEGIEIYAASTSDLFTAAYYSATKVRSTSTAPTLIVAGSWYHAVVSADRTGNFTAYGDGTPDATPVDISADAAANLANTSNFAIGRRSLGANQMNGRLKYCAVWVGTALSQAQVTALRNGGSGLACASKVPAPTECWNLGEESGDATGAILGLVLTDTNTVGSVADCPP